MSENSVYLAKLGIYIAEKNKNSFVEFYKLLNENKGRVSKEKLSKFAKKIRLDLNDLKNVNINTRLEKKLKADLDLANKLGLRGTPAFVIGDEVIFGYIPADELLEKIKLTI